MAVKNVHSYPWLLCSNTLDRLYLWSRNPQRPQLPAPAGVLTYTGRKEGTAQRRSGLGQRSQRRHMNILPPWYCQLPPRVQGSVFPLILF